MMLEGISSERIQAMSSQELRWLDNAKKAFHASDNAFASGAPEHDALEALCKAIDTAKTLHRSLQGHPHDTNNNREAFINFLYTEIPGPENNGLSLSVMHSRKGQQVKYGFAELVYEIRCMVHENENLNVAEDITYHILLDWTPLAGRTIAWVSKNRVVIKAPMLWERLRQFLSKFISHVESIYNMPQTGKFNVTIVPPLGTIYK